MKRLLLFLFLFVGAYPLLKADDVIQSIVIKLKNDMHITVNVSGRTSIEFLGENVKIHSSVFETTVPITDIVTFYYVKNNASAIDNKASKQPSILLDGDYIYIEGVPENEPTRVYAINGVWVKTKIVWDGNKSIVDLHGLERGFYILKTGNVSFKFIRL